MEILGRSLPQLQNVISSGLDSVTQGIVQNTSVLGTPGFARIKDSFLTSNLDVSTLNQPQSTISPEGEFQNPAMYFNQLVKSSAGFEQIAAAAGDRTFRPEAEIKDFAGSLKNLVTTLQGLANDSLAQRGIIIVGGKFQPSPPPIVPSGPPIRAQVPEGPPIAPQSFLSGADQRAIIVIGGRFIPTPPPIVPDGPPILPTAQFGPEGPPIMPTSQLQPSGPPIVPTAQFSPEGPPIMPTAKFRPDGPPIAPQEGPSPPPIVPAEILQSQFQVLRDMETTVRQSMGMYQQLNASMLSGRMIN